MFNQEIEQIKKEYLENHSSIEKEKQRINLAKGQIEEINRQINYEIEQREIVSARQMLYQKTVMFCSAMLENAQQSLEDTFSNIGSSALTKIFGEDKKLKFTFDKAKKKNPSINIEISQPWEDNEELVTDIMEAEGGAMIDIVSLGLRLAMIKLISPEQKGPIFLDEICRYISKNESIRATGEFLREIAEKLDKQLIIITHTPELFNYANKLFIFDIGPKKTINIKEQIFYEKTEE